MNDTQIVIVLLSRQQDRLSRQIKALYDEAFDYSTLRRWRDGWAELPLLKYHPDLLPCVDALLAVMAEGRCPLRVMDSARVEVWSYHKACWPRLKELGVDLSGYMNDFGAIDPELKRRFRRRYERKRRLSPTEQAHWLKDTLVPMVDAHVASNVAKVELAGSIARKQRRVIDAVNRFRRR
ncbi:hypothetical protein FPL11_09875 [Spiribacter aquaticus]|uniref:Transposase n=1 Tax=Spiribacter aquaticus TaxID=1935996 RepID=A0A557RE56_9GAMM|nr:MULTISPECIES: hypothetical protein [Spiribacter]KAF0279153.1 hypothetical protein BA897_00060 [Spiribacter roseus]TVO63442.1 hypothetical protein FPL11_09875 [Spiribacter aquaticus]